MKEKYVLLHVPERSVPLKLAIGPAQSADQTLAQAIWLSGALPPPPLCSGLGRCGRCRVRFLDKAPAPHSAEERLFTQEDLTQGWRLACRHRLQELALPLALALPALPPSPRSSCAPRILTTEALTLAVDLGTTSLHWRALNSQGTVVAGGQEINPQMGAGSDVMSRIAFAHSPAGLARLSELVCARLRELTQELPAVRHICLAANTAMTAIVLQKDVTGLASTPYQLPLTGNSLENLPGLPPVYVPPQLAPFVGGDVSAGMAFLLDRPDRPGRMHGDNSEAEAPFVLADMGTNGEFVLCVNEHRSFITSVPLGPALDGIGLTLGDMAGSGAGSGIVNSVSLSPQGLHCATIDGQPPRRICAAGYLSLTRVLRQCGVLDENGIFCQTPALPLGRKLADTLYTHRGETRLPLGSGLYLSAEDVEEILKVKAAFSLALEALLHAANMKAGQLRHIYLAGALGEHVPPSDLETLGFVPQGLGQRIAAVGNSSLRGAQLLALHPEKRDDLSRWSASCQLVSLAEQPDFIQNYMRHMRFV